MSLSELLELVGELKDDSTPNNASERFRRHLQKSIQKVEEVRAYIDEALGQPGEQFNKALQDLINHVGQLLGFEVTYGRYRGVRGENGFDGLWRSQTGWSIVVETKTTDAYSIKTATLLGYINSLISEGQVKDADRVLGLYVYGRYDTQTNQLENTIIAEKRRDSLRVIGVEALLNLLELKQKYSLSHEVVLSLFLPAPVRIDSMVNLIFDVVVEGIEQAEESENSKDFGSNQQELSQKEGLVGTETGRIRLVQIDEDYTGKTIKGFEFQNQRYDVSSWPEVISKLCSILVSKDEKKFSQIAVAIRGKKRKYISLRKEDLRSARVIPGTSYFFESNFSADDSAKLCYTLIESMGYDRSDLILDAI
jgi:hypothetical protein